MKYEVGATISKGMPITFEVVFKEKKKKENFLRNTYTHTLREIYIKTQAEMLRIF